MQSYTSAGLRQDPYGKGQDEVAAFSFVDKFWNNGYSTSVRLNICALHDALYSMFLKSNEQKILVLYLHNQRTEFSRNFCTFVSNKYMERLFDDHFNILGWDVEDDTFEELLCDTLSSVSQLQSCVEMIRRKESASIFITLIDMNFEICSIMRSSSSLDDFQLSLEILVDCFYIHTQDEIGPASENGENSEKCGYEDFQQRMFDSLGNRDYDLFEANEMDFLKEKIAFALFGLPREESGYADKQIEERDKMYEIISKVNSEFCDYKDQVVMAVVFNCLVPLKADDVNNDYSPVPVFTLRKCRESENPCRMIVDHTRRVYESWNDYLEDNKFCKCLMVVPEGGRYAGDECGNVKLEKLKSPACSTGKKLLKATDITSTVLGLGSSGVVVASAIPAVTLAPVALLGAAAVGVGVGVYSIGRSIHTLVDRGKHKEIRIECNPRCCLLDIIFNVFEEYEDNKHISHHWGKYLSQALFDPCDDICLICDIKLSSECKCFRKFSLNVKEAEARGAYINIAAGTVGFAGAGANATITQLASNGVAIGTTARIAVNSLSVANIGIGGLAVGNSAVEIIMRWWIDDETPSALTVFQLSTSILFFSHAVYNFRTAGTIIEESQTNVLNDMKGMLKSNRQRKIFRKLELETIRLNNGDVIRGRAEVIAATLKMNNKDDVFAFLVRSNKKFNEMGIKFSAKDGRMSFNGIPVDVSEISSLSRSEVSGYFSNLTHKPTTYSRSISTSMHFDFKGLITLDNAVMVCRFVVETVNSKSLREKICIILTKVFDYFSAQNSMNSGIAKFFNQLFPNAVRYLEYTSMILSFIRKQVELLQEKFRNGEPDDLYNLISKYLGDLDEVQRKLLFIQLVCDNIILAFRSPSTILKKLEIYVMEWAINAGMRQQERREREVQREIVRSEQISCKKCDGYYFK